MDVYLETILNTLFSIAMPPFIIWFMLYTLYSKFLWKLYVFRVFHCIPNLNGTWHGRTYKDEGSNKVRYVTVVIKQDWNHISIRTFMDDSQENLFFCKCTVAAIDVTDSDTILKYAYINTYLGKNSYIGYNELQVLNGERISGKYITTKPTSGMFEVTKI